MKKLTIIRKWNNPQILISVSNEQISLEMSLDDFIRALTDEVAEPLVESIAATAGSPGFLFTNAQLQKRMVNAVESDKAQALFKEAAERIITEVKKETVKVV